ncbi:MAG: exodeoxyribonuclease VII large subunit [Deltaproteobacteria bacterium]|nr:exodeoxyribonuclease VII large subunit [Deltaproteobacteria bacterium]
MLQFATTKYLSVSELSKSLNLTLERSFPEVFFQGEISQIARPASGHLYFTLKDDKSQLAAVMWKGMLTSLKFRPEAGMQVQCHGRPNIFHVNGKLQIVVHFMALAGEGLLQKKFLELKAKLEKEGVFDEQRKRKLPFLPRAIGIVTSPTGAVIHDIMVRLSERMPIVKTFLLGVRVQGEGASQEIADAIQHFNELKNVDVIIVARGGGSLEDLWAFNEEKTVRAIFGSRIPVICGVGHEVDTTLSDLAADVRAPTPTAAAEMVVPRLKDLLKELDGLERRLTDYQRWHAPLVQRVDEVSIRLDNAARSAMQQARLKIDTLEAKIHRFEPARLVTLFHSKTDLLSERLNASARHTFQKLAARIESFEQRLLSAGTARLQHCAHRLESTAARLAAINPASVLERGYSIVEHEGKVVTASSEVKVDDSLKVTLNRGSLHTKVKEIVA